MSDIRSILVRGTWQRKHEGHVAIADIGVREGLVAQDLDRRLG